MDSLEPGVPGFAGRHNYPLCCKAVDVCLKSETDTERIQSQSQDSIVLLVVEINSHD